MIDGWWWHGVMRGPGLLLSAWLFMVAIAAIALVVWLIVKLLRSASGRSALTPSGPQNAPADPILETLRRRLAEGTITVEEFDTLRQKLGV